MLDSRGIQRTVLGVCRCSLVLPSSQKQLRRAIQIRQAFLIPRVFAFLALLLIGCVGVVLQVLGHITSTTNFELGALTLRIDIRQVPNEAVLALYLVVDARKLADQRLNMHFCRSVPWRCFSYSRSQVSKCCLLHILPIRLQTFSLALVVVPAAAEGQDVSIVARRHTCNIDHLGSSLPLLNRGCLLMPLHESLQA